MYMNFVREKTRNRWKEQIKGTGFEIKKSNDFSFIDSFVRGKRIILLGESSHGVADYFTTKTDLIRYLHQYHGFNVVAFESGLLEATLCKDFLNDKSPDNQIQSCFLDIYHNEEIKPLFFEEWSQSLIISGMDPQPTYPLISECLIDWLKLHTDNELYQTIKVMEKRFFEIDDEMRTKLKVTKTLKERMKITIKEYESLIYLIDEKREIYMNPEIQKRLQLVKQGMQNRMKWLKINLKGFLSSGIQRGFNMFQNLEWLMNDYYKNEKIIVWAHNFHIRKRQTITAKILGIKSVGYWLQRKYPNDFYSIGLYAGSGEFATQLRVVLPVNATNKNHLESLLYETAETDLFLPLNVKNQTKDKKMWFKRKWWLLESGYSGLSPKVIYPQEQYDAIIFIREVKSPNYLKRS